MQEIELKFIEIEKEDIVSRIEELGGEKKYSYELQSTMFDAPGYSINSTVDSKMLRVRKIGEQTLLTHKSKRQSEEFDIREETEILACSSYEEAITFIEKLGFESHEHHKKHRTHYELGNIHFEIEEYEQIPPYLEIETHSEEDMVMICQKLGLDITKGKPLSIFDIYPELKIS